MKLRTVPDFMVRGRILVLGIEDDGVLSFGPDAPRFHVSYAPALIAELTEAAAPQETDRLTNNNQTNE